MVKRQGCLQILAIGFLVAFALSLFGQGIIANGVASLRQSILQEKRETALSRILQNAYPGAAIVQVRLDESNPGTSEDAFLTTTATFQTSDLVSSVQGWYEAHSTGIGGYFACKPTSDPQCDPTRNLRLITSDSDRTTYSVSYSLKLTFLEDVVVGVADQENITP